MNCGVEKMRLSILSSIAGWAVLVFTGSLVFTSSLVAADTLKPDMEQSKIIFVGGKPDGSTHDGGFKKFSVEVSADFEEPSNSTLRIEFDMASLFADDPRLEGHLKNPDFFDVRKYPKAVFESTKIEANEQEATITGKLKMLDKTQEVKVPAKLEVTDEQVKMVAKFKIDRTKWGMNYGVEGNKINKEVEITAELVFKR
jgi:polyisoprenoid-binding protein YceI